MANATLTFGASGAVIDKRIYGSFLEHMGRAIYGGVVDDAAMEVREDVLSLVRESGVTLVRYPGGNFVSGYFWEDGVGKRRTRRIDRAWGGAESNKFGTDEFLSWCGRAGVEPMMAVNLGSRGPRAAAALVEYCNGASDTRRGAMRGGEPYGVKLWCLGNEMDGPWQIGHKDARTYALLARESARAMRAVDPTVALVACGSSNPSMSTFGSWEREVLSVCRGDVDYLSLHGYWGKFTGESNDFLASSVALENAIEAIEAIEREGRRERGGRRIYLSVDEWNVNYHDRMKSASGEEWREWYRSSPTFEEFYAKWGPSVSAMRERFRGMDAPPILEDVYTLEDALVVGTLLTTLARHAESVRIACLAQLVNVIAPIMTDSRRAWAQTIFHPFMQMARWGRGEVIETIIDCPAMEAYPYGKVPILEGVALRDGAFVTLFITNRSLTEGVDFVFPLSFRSAVHSVMDGPSLLSVNTADNPFCVRPRKVPLTSSLVHLPPHSWSMVRAEV